MPIPTDANGESRPISRIAIPLAAVLSIGAAVLMSVLSVSAAGLWAGVSWWRAELEGMRREIQIRVADRVSVTDALRKEMLAHAETDGHATAMNKLAVLDREMSGFRERLSTFDAQLRERDTERVRRLEALERRGERRDQDWESMSQRMATVEEQLRTLRQGHAELSVAGEMR